MSRYIDAEELREVVEQWDMQDLYLPAHFLDLIEDIPTADVAEVVRCKECKHYHQFTGFCEKNSYFYDDNGLSCSPLDSPNWTMFSDDDFCSRGERRSEVEDI